MRGLRWAILKSKLRATFTGDASGHLEFGTAAGRSRLHAIVSARDLLGRQRAALDGAWDTLGFRLTDEIMRWIKVQFLWGVFYEVVADGPDFPTNGYDRLLLHVIDFLMKERGLTLEDARDTALRLQRMFNEADCLFDAIEQRGRLAYRHGSDQHFIEIALALHETGLPNKDEYVRFQPA